MPSMIMRNNNGVLEWDDGTPVFEIGMMMVELLEHTANNSGFAWGYNPTANQWNVINPPSVEFINNELSKLANDGWRVIRCRAVPMSYPNKFTESWGPASEYGTPSYWATVDATWDKMQAMMDHAASLGIGIMFDFWGSDTTFADYLWQADSTIRISDWGDVNSSLFLKAKEVTQRFVSRFKDHPAVSAWEVMGEWDGAAYYGNAPDHSYEPAYKGYRTDYTKPEDVLTDSDLITYMTAMVAAIREVDDTGRFIGSGTFGQKDIPRDDKFFARYLPLQTMTDGASTHHYEGMPAGNRDYSAFKDHLILLRKKAFEHGLVAYIGEHGVSNDYIHISRDAEYYTDIEYDAIIDSGTQLSFHWNWMGTPGGPEWQPSSRGVHPDANWPTVPGQYQMLLSKLDKIHNTKWYPPNNMALPEFGYDLPTSAITTDGTNKYELPMPVRTDGVTVSFWYNPRKGTGWGQAVMLSSFDSPGNSTALGDYRFPEGNNGWMFRQTYTGIDFGVRLSDGTLKYTGGFQLDIDRSTGIVTEDIWIHVCLQVISPEESWDGRNSVGPHQAPTVRVHVNGVFKSQIEILDAANPWIPATNSQLVIGGLKESYLENLDGTLMRPASGAIADLKLFNRPLKDREVYDLYLNDTVPMNTLSGHWSFENGSLTNSVNGQSGTVIAGTSSHETVTLPTNTQMIDWTYTPYVTPSSGATLQLKRGDSTYVNSYTGPEGELVVNTDTKTVLLQDGETSGGIKIDVAQDYKQVQPFKESSALYYNGRVVDSQNNKVSEVVYVLNDLSDIYNDAKTLKSNGARLAVVRVNLSGYDSTSILNAIKILKLEKINTLLRLENGTSSSVSSAVQLFKNINGVAGWITDVYAVQVSSSDNKVVLSNDAANNIETAFNMLADGKQIVLLEFYGKTHIHSDTSGDMMSSVRKINDRLRSENRGI